MRNESDHCAKFGDAEYHKYDPGHDRRHDQSVDTMQLNDSVNDDDERTSRPANLNARTAERGDQKSGDNCGVESAVGSYATGDGECYREGESYDADDHARDQIGRKLRTAVRLECRDRLRD
jgi:hypothetical protein